jgi:hypothetical protein
MADEVLVPETLTPEAQGLSQVERVVDTFVAPAKTFTDILRSTSWWLPFVLGTISSYLLTFAIATKVGWSQLVDNTVLSNPSTQAKMANMTPDQVAMQHKIMTYSFQGGFYAAPLINLVYLLVIAVAIWAVINFVFGGKSNFGQVFCVANYAFLPAAVKAVIAALVLFFGTAAENFTLQNMLGTSPGYYIEDAGPLKTFLTSFDLITLWTLVLMSLGLAIVAKTKRSSGFIVIFGLWFLTVLVGTGMAAISS